MYTPIFVPDSGTHRSEFFYVECFHGQFRSRTREAGLQIDQVRSLSVGEGHAAPATTMQIFLFFFCRGIRS